MDLRALEMDVSSGGCRTGEASIPPSTKAATPIRARSQRTVRSPVEIIRVMRRLQSFVEYSISQSIADDKRELTGAVEIAPLAQQGKKSDSIAMAIAESLINAPEFTVSELSSAL